MRKWLGGFGIYIMGTGTVMGTLALGFGVAPTFALWCLSAALLGFVMALVFRPERV